MQSAPDHRMHAIAARIQRLTDEFAASPDAAVRQKAQELARLLMELYGDALRCTLRIVEQEDAARSIMAALLRDELLASLLVLHDLHPDDSVSRISRELKRVRDVAGADVVLLEVLDATARVQVRAQRQTRAPSTSELQRLIEEMVQAAAPAIERVEIEGLTAEAPALVQLTRAPVAERFNDVRAP